MNWTDKLFKKKTKNNREILYYSVFADSNLAMDMQAQGVKSDNVVEVNDLASAVLEKNKEIEKGFEWVTKKSPIAYSIQESKQARAFRELVSASKKVMK